MYRTDKRSSAVRRWCVAALAAIAAVGAPHAWADNVAQAEASPNAIVQSCGPKPEDYPAESVRAGEKGNVKVRIRVSADGHVAEVKLERSSGFPRLDEASLAVLRSCTLPPATEGGKPVEKWTTVEFRWRLEGAETAEPALSDESEKKRTASGPETANVTWPKVLLDRCQNPEYPPESIRAEETGTTTMRFVVSAEGRLVKAEVMRSSGFARLDEAALTALSQCPFLPATESGKPVEKATVINYVWKLHASATAAPAPQGPLVENPLKLGRRSITLPPGAWRLAERSERASAQDGTNRMGRMATLMLVDRSDPRTPRNLQVTATLYSSYGEWTGGRPCKPAPDVFWVDVWRAGMENERCTRVAFASGEGDVARNSRGTPYIEVERHTRADLLFMRMSYAPAETQEQEERMLQALKAWAPTFGAAVERAFQGDEGLRPEDYGSLPALAGQVMLRGVKPPPDHLDVAAQ